MPTPTQAGNSFMSLFTTFGTFSIAAGILLIFLIFVMLAAERRGELGIARAVGTRRSHLVQMFVFEGAAYDLVAAVIGAAAGRSRRLRDGPCHRERLRRRGLRRRPSGRVRGHGASLFVAFAIGVLLTLVVVAVSAWRVSVMTISTAIRNLPEPPSSKSSRRWILAALGLALGVFIAVSGAAADAATALMLGVSLVVISLVPILRAARSSGAARIHGLWPGTGRAHAHAVGGMGGRVRPDLDGLLDVDHLRPDDGHRSRRG